MYETSELPESDQHLGDQDGGVGAAGDGGGGGECVEVLHISAQEALGRFTGKSVDARGVDFSDRIRRGANSNRGYRAAYATRGEYELCAPGEEETPLQRYHRLACEVGELAEQVGQADKAEEGKLAAAGDAKASVSKIRYNYVLALVITTVLSVL